MNAPKTEGEGVSLKEAPAREDSGREAQTRKSATLRRRGFLKALAAAGGAVLTGSGWGDSAFARSGAGGTAGAAAARLRGSAAGSEPAGAPGAVRRERRLHVGRLVRNETARGRTSFITPNEDFYLVAVDPSFRPRIGLAEWQLELVAPGAPQRALGYGELTALPSREVLRTFECIGNDVGEDLIGNARWQAVQLRDVLAPVLPQRGIEDLRLLMVGLDEFYTTVPLAMALADEAWVAFRMNGEVLPKAHGWPARTMLPDRYGMKQPRWLKRLEITSKKTTGFWEERGWSWDAPIKIMSRIDTPRRGERIGRGTGYEMTGIAYAGDRPVGRVEVTLDEGKTWHPARITTEPRGHVWSLWSYEWTPAVAGNHVLGVRAFDADGKKQITKYDDPDPDGASGIHAIKVKVEK